jgi:hypothetical protein
MGSFVPHPTSGKARLLARAYYSSTVSAFLAETQAAILGKLAGAHQFDLDPLQRNAWIEEVAILRNCLREVREGYLLLEYAIPRVGKRIDAVVLTSGIVFALEFKVGGTQYFRADFDQVHDYALDLKNFHEESHDKPIIPVLVVTKAPPSQLPLVPADDKVFVPLAANKENLGILIRETPKSFEFPDFNYELWRDSRYKPTPTIIEAAQALYLGHSVIEISRSDAGATNLTETSRAIGRIIAEAKARRQKAICFVTGVPGSGKTLAGLNIANERLQADENEHAVFLSGNGPLVKVLREALARNAAQGESNAGRQLLSRARSKTAAFIQNVHHFRDEALRDARPPLERVVIFDEAQRAWTLQQTASFMKRKKGLFDFSMSEPEFLISVMDRHQDWAVIVCLIGGGQEINTGEAGLPAWFHALDIDFPQWRVYVSPELSGYEYLAGKTFSELIDRRRVNNHKALHLGVSIRSYRSEKVADFVRTLLEGETENCARLYDDIRRTYPIVLTRDLGMARDWLVGHARGSERYGLLASSGAARLRPLGIDVGAGVDVINWFLGPKEDVRSSYYLEAVASEFDVQGLELDWTGVVWDADLRYHEGDWQYLNFRGTAWQRVNEETRRQYLKNAYRVLLTRARQGMVIVVPEGNRDDWTRQPDYYDGTFRYLFSIGTEPLEREVDTK